jgi:hypothetical protein
MNLAKILAELLRERKLIDEAVASLERLLVAGGKPRRGRPPAWLQAYKSRGRGNSNRRERPGAATAGAA